MIINNIFGMSIGKRLKQAIDNKGITVYKLHKDSKVSQSTIARVLKDEGGVNRSTIVTLSKYLDVDADWIMEGESTMESKNNLSPAGLDVNDAYELEYVENNNANTFMRLENGQYLMTMPLADFNVQAGLLDHYQDIDYLKDMAQHSIIVDEPAKGRYMAFKVKGDSMDDGTSNAIVPNSIVSTRELQRQHWTSKLRFKDFPYWIIYTTQNKMPLLKEITAHDTESGTITCHSLNDSPEYNDFTLSLNEVQALFYVVGVSRELSKKSYY